jgi:hypothetical protein
MTGENGSTEWGLKYFTYRELRCKASLGFRLADGFGKAIDDLREAWGKPLIVTSCCRSAEYNRQIGGHPRSLHVYDNPYYPTNGTCAIDVKETSEHFRALAWDMGFSIGRGNGFTHLDTRHSTLGKIKTIFEY